MINKKAFLATFGLMVASTLVMTGCASSALSPGAQTASDPVSYQQGYEDWLKIAKKAAEDPETFAEENQDFSYRYTFHLGDNMYFSAQLLPNGKVVECLGASASPSCNWNPSEDISNW